MNKTVNAFIHRAINNACGDDLERAQSAFRHRNSKQMLEQWGTSGKTCAQILEECQTDRQLWNQAKKLIDETFPL